MTPAFSFVHPDEVDWDDPRFEIPAHAPDEELAESMRRFGCLTPPWVLAKEGPRYAVVDGFKRLRLLRETPPPGGVPCLVYPRGTEFGDLLIRRIEVRCLRGMPNTAETAVIVRMLHEISPAGEGLSRVLRRLGISPKPGVVADWVRLAAADRSLLAAAASGTVSARTALRLAAWEKDEGASMLELFSLLRCSVSVQAEILDGVTAIAAAAGMERLDVLRSEGVLALLAAPGKAVREKSESLRRHLYEWQYPRLRQRERRFELEVARAGIPAGMRLLPPPSFEGERWRLEMSFSSESELADYLEKARGLVTSGMLQTIRSRQTPQDADGPAAGP